MLGTSAYMVAFRIVHIMAGIAWGGAVFLLVMYIQPTSAAIAPAGAPFMAELLGKRRLVDGLIGLGSTTVVGGLFLYWHDWHNFSSFGDWISSRFGITITIGAVSAIVALAVGVLGTRPNVQRLLGVGRQVAQSGGPPSPEQAAQIAALQIRLKVLARVSLGFIAVAALTMAIARYL